MKQGHVYQIGDDGKIKGKIFDFMDEILIKRNLNEHVELEDLILLLELIKDADNMIEQIKNTNQDKFILDQYRFGKSNIEMVNKHYLLGNLDTITKEELITSILEIEKVLGIMKGKLVIDNSITKDVFSQERKVVLNLDSCIIEKEDCDVYYSMISNQITIDDDGPEGGQFIISNIKNDYKIKISYIVMEPEVVKGLNNQLNEFLKNDTKYTFVPYILIELVKEG